MLSKLVSVRKSLFLFAAVILSVSLMSASCQQDGCPNQITKEYPKEERAEESV